VISTPIVMLILTCTGWPAGFIQHTISCPWCLGGVKKQSIHFSFNLSVSNQFSILAHLIWVSDNDFAARSTGPLLCTNIAPIAIKIASAVESHHQRSKNCDGRAMMIIHVCVIYIMYKLHSITRNCWLPVLYNGEPQTF